MSFPADSSGREIPPLVILTEFRRTVGTKSGSKQILIIISVIQTGHSGNQFTFREPVGNNIVRFLSGSHILISQCFIHKTISSQIRITILIPLVRMTYHGAHFMFAEHLRVIGKCFGNKILILCVTNDSPTTILRTDLGVFLWQILVVGRFSIFIIQLACETKLRYHLPFNSPG